MIENESMHPEQISQPIETENAVEREKELARRLTALEVHFADSQYKGKGDFSYALYEYTPIMRRLRNRYRDIHEEKEVDEKLAFATSIENEINKIYRETPDQEEREKLITQYVFNTYANLKREEPGEIEQAKEKDSAIGVIRIEPGVREEPYMEEAGFGPEEKFLPIHFPAFYENDTEKSLLAEVHASFTKLAEMIPQKYPEARGIIGESWLLSLPVAERLGFKKIMTFENQFSGEGLWSQFIDQNGNISKSRFDKFVKTGKPPYDVALGYIPVEEFLSKYLPADKKGEIILKEINPEWKKEDTQELEKYTDETHQLRSDWKNFVEDKNLSAEEFIKTYPAIVSVMTKVDCYDDILKVLSEAKSKGYQLQEMVKIMPTESKRIEEAYTEYAGRKYRNRTVLIR